MKFFSATHWGSMPKLPLDTTMGCAEENVDENYVGPRTGTQSDVVIAHVLSNNYVRKRRSVFRIGGRGSEAQRAESGWGS